MEELKELKREKAKLKKEVKELEDKKLERERDLMEIEILSKQAEESQTLATLKKRILREIDYSTDDLKMRQTKLMLLIDEAWDIGDKARERLKKEADFLRKTADAYTEKADRINKDVIVEAEFKEMGD